MDKNYQKKKRTGNLPPKSKTVPKTNAPVISEKPAIPWNSTVVLGIHAGIIVAFLLILRLNLMDLPLERDESAYAYLGQRAGEGLAPYRDFYEMKPPFLFYGYALLNAVFGYSAWGLRLTAWFLSLLICGGVYLTARALFGAKYGLLAALTMALISASPYVMMTFAESELLVMSLAIYGVWLLCLLLSKPGSSVRQERIRLVGAGVLIGSAVMVKQSAIFFLGFAAVVLVLLAEGNNFKARLGKLITSGLWFSLGAIAPVLVCLGIVWGFGVWEDFAFWNFEYPQLYTERKETLTWQTLLSVNFQQLIQDQVFLWVLGGLGLLALLLRLNEKRSIALLALTVFSFLTVVPGQRFYLHYWIQFVPIVAILLAHLFFQLEKLGQNVRFSSLKSLSTPLGFVVLFMVTGLSAPVWLQGESAAIMRKMFGSNPFVEDELVARLIDSSIQPNETVAVLGSEPQIYVYLKRKAPSRHFYTAFLSRQHRLTRSWHDEALQGLTTQKPDYVVFVLMPLSWMLRPDSNQGFYQNAYRWVMANYSPIAWADYEDVNNPTIVTDAAASTYQPRSSSYIMVMKRKN
ncbi:ArnT family glycosyltransferase [Haliscomenobacter hydrossis]|uniref:Glycosyltransferase RgtA/B/C/D-like domain-containing protein n=1 Tax=Haliscomenobacter hydrossis (strain ATCC 27775 / DSM 1100 / LMG 10767 / O) TaxID=760192 RepID=F4KT99_HALH1|nr:glycosyltransferase family 39 protein [Haliscomenobacter hydrossis]AEE51156.1 hypothetical protein Halhy_3297 [Haliscomenobacter hydrossis DSM 1100]